MSTLFYSFDTKRNRKLLEGLDHEVFYFKRLKYDFETFKDIIITQNPDHIIGIAAFRTTQFESKAINQFNKSKTVSVKGKDSYNLSIPKIGCKIHKSAYDSFCNWSSYKVSEFVDKWGLSSQVSFLHCTLEDNVMIKKLVISF